MFDILLSGGRIIDGSGLPAFHADLAVQGGRIAAVGRLDGAAARQRLDATGKVVAPGFIDAHVHGDLRLLVDPLHEPAIRQGVTTYVLGQDGVAMAPGSPATIDYMRRYTAGFSGLYDGPQRWYSLGDYLDGFDRRCAAQRRLPGAQRQRAHGGDGTGDPATDCRGTEADAPPGARGDGAGSGRPVVRPRLHPQPLRRHAGAERPVRGDRAFWRRLRHPHAPLRSRGRAGVDGRGLPHRPGGRLPVHISHFNSRAELVLPHFDAATVSGLDATYDLYCYLAASSILGMVALPPWVQEGGSDATLARLRRPRRARAAARLVCGTACAAGDGASQFHRRRGLPPPRRADA